MPTRSSWPAGRTTTSSMSWPPRSSASWASSRRRCATTPRSSAGLTRRHRHAAHAGRDAGVPRFDRARQAGQADRSAARLDRRSAEDIYNDAYAAYWSLKWSDLLRNSSRELGEQGMWAMHNWIKESFRTNKPFDKFVRELITAKGSIYTNGPANYYRIDNDPPMLAESDGAAVPGRAAGVCQVPPSSVREIQPGRLLRLGRVLRPRRHEEQRGVRPVRRRAGGHGARQGRGAATRARTR